MIDYVGYLSDSDFRGHYLAPISTVTSVRIVAQQYVPTMGPWFPLMRSNDPGPAGCLLPSKNSVDRETRGWLTS
jgi:hypothetical protein